MKNISYWLNPKLKMWLVKITYPHWSSGKPVQQLYKYYNDEKGVKQLEKSLNRFYNKGYKLVNN